MYKPFFNYKKAIHPDCGKEVKIHQDIIITPFYTEEFCDHLVEVAKFYDKKFTQSVFYVEGKTHNLTKNSPWDTLYLSRISLLLFEDFCDHYEKFICPLIEKNFSPLTITQVSLGKQLFNNFRLSPKFFPAQCSLSFFIL